ncbi:class I SAM-dependent methyltransferase [Candidatus Woesearchaeota archaeon]|nr:class I SAM-dependent methyltransferase [Candidatus Woesearchaeota archaeon]
MNYEQLYSGEHLKKINPKWTFRKWSYRHTFVAKMKYVTKLLQKTPKTHKILDAGCGQGLLVEHLRKRGYDVRGIDAFYGSEYVHQGDLLQNDFSNNTFDVILCLDVIEHFPLLEQEKLIQELTRILKPNGKIIWSIPNQAHLSSRFLFLLTGRLLRTAKVEYHPGDRPITEYYRLLRKHLTITQKKGLSPTIPILFQATQVTPQYTGWLHTILRPFALVPNWCFNVIVITKKGERK